jgi:hypothetical protein
MPSLQQAAQDDRQQRQYLHPPSFWDALELMDRILTAARHVLGGYILLQWSIAISYAIGNWSLFVLTCIIMVAIVTRERLRRASTP